MFFAETSCQYFGDREEKWVPAMLSFCVLALNLLVAIPMGYVTAQEEKQCEFVDFPPENTFEMEPCATGEVFTWTPYNDGIPLLRAEESQGLLTASGSFCGIYPNEIMLTQTSGVFIPIYFETSMNIALEIVDPVDPQSEDSVVMKFFLDSSLNEWNMNRLPDIVMGGDMELPKNYKIKISGSSENPEEEGQVYIDFIQIFNSDNTEENDECVPKVIEETETTTDPSTITTEETTTEETTTEETTTEEATTTEETTTEPSDTESTEPTENTETTDPTEATKPTETEPTETEPPPTDPPTLPEPEAGDTEWKVVAAVFISLFCGACVLIMLLIFKPFLVKSSTPTSGLVTNEHPMSRTTLPRLQVDSGSSGISGVNRTTETSWP